MSARPFEILVHMIKSHEGKPVEVFMKGDPEPWELLRIDIVYMDAYFTFIEGRTEDGLALCINLDHVSTLVFSGPDPETGDEVDPEVEKKKLGILKVVNG